MEWGCVVFWGCVVCCVACAMELRRRQGKGKDTAGNPEQRAGTNDVPASDSTSDHPQVIDRDIPSNSDAADAVVGAAVRGGSLLMLLALLQVTSGASLSGICIGLYSNVCGWHGKPGVGSYRCHLRVRHA